MVVWKKHGTEMKDILIMHFIAKPYTDRNVRFTIVVAAARCRAELHDTVLNFVRPHVIYKRYRFAMEEILCCTIRRV